MRIILTPIGSSGDVFPFVAIGSALHQRGHHVTVITNGHFEPLIRAAGLEFIEMGDDKLFRNLIKDPLLWHPTRGFHFVMGHALNLMPELYKCLRELYQPGQTLVVAHTLDMASRVLHDEIGLPVVAVQLSPIVIRTVIDPPCPRGTLNLGILPPWFLRGLFWAVDRFMVDPSICPRLNAFRAERGLPPVRRALKEWINTHPLTIGMFPDWFGPPQPDWPAHIRLAGFPLWDGPGVHPMPASVESFLDSGTPPIVFTPGSAVADARPFVAAAVDACGRLRRRGLLLSRFIEVSEQLPPDILHCEFAPLSQFLHRCAALVHHGGVGTTAAGFAAGVPQVIMPMSHDQPDNAARVVRLGVGDRLLPRRFTGKNLARKLDPLLKSEDVARKCRELAQDCRNCDGLQRACDLIETLFPAAHPAALRA